MNKTLPNVSLLQKISFQSVLEFMFEHQILVYKYKCVLGLINVISNSINFPIYIYIHVYQILFLEGKKKGKGKKKYVIDNSYLASHYYIAMVTGLGFLNSAVNKNGVSQLLNLVESNDPSLYI